MSQTGLLTVISSKIFTLREQQVMLDRDLAEMYGVTTKVLNQAVQRNLKRFPFDFMFQLTAKEFNLIRSQFVTLDEQLVDNKQILNTESAISKTGAHTYRPYAFTEQGVAMLSSVLKSDRAVTVNIAIMRAFVAMRALLLTNHDLAQRLAALEQKYDAQFREVFNAIRQLMTPPATSKTAIGFIPPRDKMETARRKTKI